MAGNTFGTLFRITTFGESHGAAMGVVIDGCPPLVSFDAELMTRELARRKPGQSYLTTQRDEPEAFEILSGIYENKTTGAPVAIIIRNKDQRPGDYDALKDIYRPSHADYTYEKKYGIRDHRGSGRASARETVARVMGGAIAKMILKTYGIEIQAYVSEAGGIGTAHYTMLDLSLTEQSIIRCPDKNAEPEIIACIEKAKAEGDSIGGTITCVIRNVPAGTGDPVFDKLHADLGKAMLSINACKGFDIGSGFEGVKRKGSEENDAFITAENTDIIHTKTNNSGGVQGGISNGEDVYFRCAFKPVSTISVPQQTVDNKAQPAVLEAAGRHDPCVLPRAVPIVEAMAAMVIADHLMRQKAIS